MSGKDFYFPNHSEAAKHIYIAVQNTNQKMK